MTSSLMLLATVSHATFVPNEYIDERENKCKCRIVYSIVHINKCSYSDNVKVEMLVLLFILSHIILSIEFRNHGRRSPESKLSATEKRLDRVICVCSVSSSVTNKGNSLSHQDFCWLSSENTLIAIVACAQPHNPVPIILCD